MSTGVALIGLGVMGTRMLGSLTVNDGFRPVTMWDPSDHARDAAAAAFPDVAIAADAAAAIDAPGVDVVYIACPPATHVVYAEMAAAAGKAIYCEKPLAVDLAESEKLVAIVNDGGLPNAVNYLFGAALTVDFIEEQLAAGALGEIVGVDLRLHFVPWPRVWQQSATWLSDRAEGGYLREVGSHFIFLTEKLFGPATLVDSSVSYPADGVACETGFSLRLDCSGRAMSMSGSSVGAGPDVVEYVIWGTERSIKLDNWTDVYVSSGGDWERQEIFGADDPRRANSDRFLGEFDRLLQGRPSSVASFADALSVQRLVEGALGSTGSA